MTATPVMKFAVIGYPVGHSLSPAFHTANFRALGFAGTYEAVEVAPEALGKAVRRFVREGYRGFNCTIPHKETVMPLLDKLDVSAVTCGAVNTVRIATDGTTTGFNTDCSGFARSLEESRPDFDWKVPVLLLGAGGAARAVAVACLEKGCASLTIANRTLMKAEALAAVLRSHYAAPIAACARESLANFTYPLVINATSLGLRPDDPSALPPERFTPGMVVADLIPIRRETATLTAARRAGALAVGGLGMLIHQGAAAFRIWTGLEPDVPAMRAALAVP